MDRQLAERLVALLPPMEFRGEVSVAAPGSPVPPPLACDMARDAAADYDDDTDCESTKAWIRRAAHAEAFARALEAELDRLRG
jgi:hypothetical protein